MKKLLLLLLLGLGCDSPVETKEIVSIHLENMQQRAVEVKNGFALPNSPIFTPDSERRLVADRALKNRFFSCELLKEFVSTEKRYYLIRMTEPEYDREMWFIEIENVILDDKLPEL